MNPSIGDVAALVGIFSSLVAIVGLIVELRSSRLALQTQTLLDLEERFYSQEMKTLRQTAAKKLLAAETNNPELEDTLDFLHSVVMLIERKVIDPKLAKEFYKYWIARYWQAAESYILAVRKIDDPFTYTKIEHLARQIIKESPEINYSAEANKVFLLKEAGITSEVAVSKGTSKTDGID